MCYCLFFLIQSNSRILLVLIILCDWLSCILWELFHRPGVKNVHQALAMHVVTSREVFNCIKISNKLEHNLCFIQPMSLSCMGVGVSGGGGYTISAQRKKKI